MAGQIKQMIDTILERRCKGNPVLISTTSTKLILKGIDPAKFSSSSNDDPAVIAKIRTIAAEMGITI